MHMEFYSNKTPYDPFLNRIIFDFHPCWNNTLSAENITLSHISGSSTQLTAKGMVGDNLAFGVYNTQAAAQWGLSWFMKGTWGSTV